MFVWVDLHQVIWGKEQMFIWVDLHHSDLGVRKLVHDMGGSPDSGMS